MAFLIYCNEDGMNVLEFKKGELHQKLVGCGLLTWTAMTEVTESDPAYWGEKYLLIDGNAVVPRAITTITKMEM